MFGKIEKDSPLFDAVHEEDSQLAVAQKLYDMGMDPDLDKMNMTVDERGKVVRR